jgi:hypothetical protein
MLRPKTEKKCKTCGKSFRARTTLDKYCSGICTPKKENKPAGAKLSRNMAISPVSKKQAKLNRQYTAARKAFLSMPENKRCAVFPERPATEVHHKMGRRGYADEKEIPLIIDVRYFLAVSRQGHEYIERHPETSYERGWSLRRTK